MQASLNNQQANNSEDIDISDILFKYLVYWPIFAALLIVCFVTAFIYMRYKTPVYLVTASVLVKDDQKGVDEQSIVQALDMFGDKKIVENEIEVLKSGDLIQKVVINLKLYAPVYAEGRIKDVSAYVSSPVKIEAKHPELLTEVKKHLFAIDESKIGFTYDNKSNSVIIRKKKIGLNQWTILATDTIRFVANTNYKVPEIFRPLYFVLHNSKAVTEDLAGQIDVLSVSKVATVINLAMKEEVPLRGENILNELIRVYNKASIDDKNALAANTLTFVDERLHFVVAELGLVEGNIAKFKKQKGIVDISEQGKVFLDNVGDNDQKAAEINLQLAVLDEVEKYVTSKNGQAGIVPSTLGVNDAVLAQLLQTLYDLQLQYERLRKTTGESNPLLISIDDQIQKVRPNLLENIRNQRNSLIAGKATLTVNSNRYNAQLQGIPQNERELLDISRQQEIKNSIYSFLLQKREETALSFASAIADSRIIAHPSASLVPVSPKKLIVYAIAFIAAFGIGIGILVAKEMLNHNILYRSEIEKYVSWPIIGELSQNDSADQIVIGDGKRNVIAEQLRQIRTSLDYLGINETRKRILITSSISGEGKSFVATNLAVSLALTGKKVVLLELDLRKPKLSKAFNISSEKGISNYLIGKAEIEEIIKPTSVHPNLYFISSGPIPPNPSELITNGKINEMFEYLGNAFDYILADTAPVAPVTDAHILSKSCDATLYIIRHAYTPKIHVKRLQENNKVRGLKNVAIIFNGLKSRGFGKYSYGYGYGYEYGYGYGEVEEKKKKTGNKIKI